MSPVPPHDWLWLPAHLLLQAAAGRVPFTGGVKLGAQKQLPPLADHGAPWVLPW